MDHPLHLLRRQDSAAEKMALFFSLYLGLTRSQKQWDLGHRSVTQHADGSIESGTLGLGSVRLSAGNLRVFSSPGFRFWSCAGESHRHGRCEQPAETGRDRPGSGWQTL